MSLYRYAKANNKYMKDYDKNKEWPYQKFPVNNSEWIEDASQFNKAFIKNYNKESEEGYFLEAHVQY